MEGGVSNEKSRVLTNSKKTLAEGHGPNLLTREREQQKDGGAQQGKSGGS